MLFDAALSVRRRCLRTLAAAAIALPAALAIALPAQAEVKTGSYDGVTSVNLEDFIATVAIEVSSGPGIAISVDDRDGNKEPVLFEKNGDELRVYSRTAPQREKFWEKHSWGWRSDDDFEDVMEDYPLVTIQVPAGTDITVSDVASLLEIGDTGGDLTIRDTIFVRGIVGDLRTADIRINGSGELMLGNVEGLARSSIAGSGDLHYQNVGAAEINISGSGDVDVEDVAGALTIAIRGSGDVSVQDVAGKAELDIAGSGDIVVGSVSQGLTVAIRGSGDVGIVSIAGPAEVAIRGNGDVTFGGGTATALDVSITGSGDFEFDGVANDPVVAVRGSGDVYIRDYTGKVTTRGSGDMKIGNIVIDD